MLKKRLISLVRSIIDFFGRLFRGPRKADKYDELTKRIEALEMASRKTEYTESDDFCVIDGME